MISKEEQLAVTQMRRYMKPQDSVLSNTNYLPLGGGTTDDHWWGIAKVARQCKMEIGTVVVEPKFREGNWPRPDVWLPTLYSEAGVAGTGIEIWKSETMKVFLEKMQRYMRCGVLIRVGYVTVQEINTLQIGDVIRLALSRAKMPKEWIEGAGAVDGQRS